jgi:RimJ/RimL family protein N-acetyltransferase
MDELDSDQIAQLGAWVRDFTGFETPRVTTRPVTMSDDAALFDALENPRIHTSIAGFDLPFTISSVRRWLVERLARRERCEGMYAAIVHRDSGVVMGHFGAKIDVEAGGMEVGIAMNELFWGKGFVEEVCFALANDLFRAGAPALVATCAMENWPSMRILMACSFEPQGFKTIATPQGPRPSRFFRLTPEAWNRTILTPIGDGLSHDDIRARRKALIDRLNAIRYGGDERTPA